MKYVKCDYCGENIELGSIIYQQKGLCGIYCSGNCYAVMFGDKTILTEQVADNCYVKIVEE